MSEEETRDDIIEVINNGEPVKEAIRRGFKEAVIEEEIKSKAKPKVRPEPNQRLKT